MMHNLSILKIAENEYRISGTATMLEDIYKYVEFEGETYHKLRREEVIINLDELWGKNKNEFTLYEVDEFNILGLPTIKFWGYTNSHTLISNTYYSENKYVCLLQVLSEYKIIPFKIHAGKSSLYYTDIKHGIEVNLYQYGFNNSVTTDLSYQEVLKLNIPNKYLGIKYTDREFFPDGWQKFNDSQKADLLINYINKIN
jgi:hypothetical protein